MNLLTRTTLFSVVTLMFVVATAQAEITFKFTRVVETGDLVPGAMNNATFTAFSADNPSIDGNDLAFEADFNDGTSTDGIFTYSGGVINKIAFDTDPTPGGGVYNSFDTYNVMVSGGQVSFRAYYGTPGIYLAPVGGGTVSIIADTSTTIPDGTGETFNSDFGEHRRDGLKTLFEGEGPSGQSGLYLNDNGTLSVYVDLSTASPFGAGTLNVFSEPFIRGNSISFHGKDTSDNDGILADFGSGLKVVADTTMAPPGGLGNFTRFDESSSDANLLAFEARTAAGNGVYLYNDTTETITTIADSTVAIPGGVGNFNSSASNPSLSGSMVLFAGTDSSNTHGRYLFFDGTVHKLLAVGDLLDGKVVTYIWNNYPHGLSGNAVGLMVRFADGSEGIYLVSIVKPLSILEMLPGVWAAASRNNNE
ncbi:MAG: hypothetical protein GY727_15595 [Gammaproteobacteria bacterium]|nr:hypothetical protein [Gammaproteobacteria bacterium]